MCVQKCVCLSACVQLSFALWRLGNIIMLWPKGTDLPSTWLIELRFLGINLQLRGWRSLCTTSMPQTGSWVLRLHCPALKCSCLHGSQSVRHSVCVCDSDVRMAHDGSYCCCSPLFSLLYWKSWKSTDYNKKTFPNTVHLPQFTTSAASTSAN